MPGLNRRGPNGDGSMTGRKMGRCNPDNKGLTDSELLQKRIGTNPSQNFFQELGMGRGRGIGRGMGRGMGMRFRGNA